METENTQKKPTRRGKRGGRKHRRSSSKQPPTPKQERVVDEVVQRQATSKQPRFDRKDNKFYQFWYNRFVQLIDRSTFELPPYGSDTRRRDAGLLTLARSESLVSGVLSSVIERDKNRGWTLSGPVRQVNRYAERLRSLHNNEGWRHYISLSALSYYSTNLGFVGEIGFTNSALPSPAETIWNTDPTRVRLTGDPDKPLLFFPTMTALDPQVWTRSEYIHSNSMPAVETSLNEVGFCALERAITFIKIMIGLNQYNLEKLNVVVPKGIVHMKGIMENEWSTALEQYEEELKNNNQDAYQDVMMLFTQMTDASVEMISMAQLPDKFDFPKFVEILMKAYALSFGYPVGQFWAVETGSFGRAGELEVQNEQATEKGELAFSHNMKDEIQKHFLPKSLLFEFDEHNDAGELVVADVERTTAETLDWLYNKRPMDGEPIINRDEARFILAEKGMIPEEWTMLEEDAEATDLKDAQQRVLENPELREVIEYKPDTPIVEYHYPLHRQRVLFKSGHDAVRRKSFPIYRMNNEFTRHRQFALLIRSAWNRKIKQKEFRHAMKQLVTKTIFDHITDYDEIAGREIDITQKVFDGLWESIVKSRGGHESMLLFIDRHARTLDLTIDRIKVLNSA